MISAGCRRWWLMLVKMTWFIKLVMVQQPLRENTSYPRRVKRTQNSHFPAFFFFFLKKSFIYLAAPGLSCSTWDLVSWPGIEPRPFALGVQSLSHWTTREVPLPLPLTLELGSSGSSAHSRFTTLTCGYCWEEDKVYWGKWILCPWESYQFRQEITVWFHCQFQGISEREASLEIIQSVFILQMGKLRPIIMPFARK